MNISYTKKGDYLLPDLILENKKQYNIGKYGLLRLDYIKNNKKSLYIKLQSVDKLPILKKIDFFNKSKWVKLSKKSKY